MTEHTHTTMSLGSEVKILYYIVGRLLRCLSFLQSFLKRCIPYTADKKSSCNAGDPGLIPGLGRFPGEGIDYTLQYSWVPLVAKMVRNPPAIKNLPVMLETWL